MSLKTLATADGTRPGWQQCGVDYIANQLSDEDRKDLELAIANTNVRYTEIASELRSMGFDISAQTVSRHSRGECACERAK